MKNLNQLLQHLIQSDLDFILVGGFAAVLHGANQTTRDIDICITVSPENIDSLQKTLAPLHPKIHQGPKESSLADFFNDMHDFKNLHLKTDLGTLDIITQVIGVGNYFDVLKNAEEIKLNDGNLFLIHIDDLIRCKKILGGHKDLAVVEELEAIKENLQKRD